MSTTSLPPEIISVILIRLPVKDLLRYRCVSKPWCSLIDSSDFVKSHLKHSTETYSNTGLIFRRSNLYWVDLDNLNSSVELSHPIDFEGGTGTEVLGSCNGLLALFNSCEDVALWNPFTQRYRNLPNTEIEFPGDGFTICQYIIYGFGYDPINDDYKLIRLIQFYGDDDDAFDSEVKVYSLKAKTWRRIRDFPYYLRYKRTYGILVSNALHWVVSRKPESDVSKLIGAFDVVTEEYRVVPQPDYVDSDFHMNLNVLGGCLCLIANYTSDLSGEYWETKADRVDIWVMKEYGVKESWTKLYSVVQSDVNSSFSFVIPVTYSKNRGDRILMNQDASKIILYDLGRNKADEVMIPNVLDPHFEVCVCLQSLVGLGGRDGEISGKKVEKLRKRRLKKELKRKQAQEAAKKKDKMDDFLSKGFKLVL